MKNLFRMAAIAAAIAFSVPAAAQQAQAQGGRYGLGVGVTSGGLFSSGDGIGTIVFAPMAVSPTFRVEPFISLSTRDGDAVGTESNYTLGAGAFYVQPIVPEVGLYVGGRLGLNFYSAKTTGATPDKDTRRDMILAAALGGEYSPNPRIAFGAEAMLGRLGQGDTKHKDGASGTTTEFSGESKIATQATLFARFYLF